MRKMQITTLLAVAAMATAPQFASAQDAGAGKALFKETCGGCHSVEDGGASADGPNLFGVSGTPAANRGIEFSYTDALIDSGVIWDDGVRSYCREA